MQQNLNSKSGCIDTINKYKVTTWQLPCCTALMCWATKSELQDFIIDFTWVSQGVICVQSNKILTPRSYDNVYWWHLRKMKMIKSTLHPSQLFLFCFVLFSTWPQHTSQMFADHFHPRQTTSWETFNHQTVATTKVHVAVFYSDHIQPSQPGPAPLVLY